MVPGEATKGEITFILKTVYYLHSFKNSCIPKVNTSLMPTARAKNSTGY